MKVTDSDSSLCPIARALDCVGDSWTLLILREAFQGARRFDQFQRSLGIATSMLTRRLERMVDNELLEKHGYQAHPPRHEYCLTDKGLALSPVILTLYQWGEHHLPIDSNAIALVDRRTQEPIEPVLYDRRRAAPLELHEVCLVAGPDATPAIRARAERMRMALDRRDALSPTFPRETHQTTPTCSAVGGSRDSTQDSRNHSCDAS